MFVFLCVSVQIWQKLVMQPNEDLFLLNALFINLFGEKAGQ